MKTNIGEINSKNDFFEFSVIKSKDGFGHPINKTCAKWCIGEHRTLVCKYCSQKFESSCIGPVGWSMEYSYNGEGLNGKEKHLQYHQGIGKIGYITEKVEKGLDFWRCKRCGDEIKKVEDIPYHDDLHQIADRMEINPKGFRVCMHNPPDSDEPCKEEHPLINS